MDLCGCTSYSCQSFSVDLQIYDHSLAHAGSVDSSDSHHVATREEDSAAVSPVENTATPVATREEGDVAISPVGNAAPPVNTRGEDAAAVSPVEDAATHFLAADEAVAPGNPINEVVFYSCSR